MTERHDDEMGPEFMGPEFDAVMARLVAAERGARPAPSAALCARVLADAAELSHAAELSGSPARLRVRDTRWGWLGARLGGLAGPRAAVAVLVLCLALGMGAGYASGPGGRVADPDAMAIAMMFDADDLAAVVLF